MAFNNYLEDENDKPYFTTNSLAYYYDKMEGFAKAVEGSAKALNLTKEEIEQRIALRLAEWDKNLESFDGSVEKLLTEWVDDGTLTHVIDSTLIDQKIAPVTAQLTEKLNQGEVSVMDIDKDKGKFDQTYMTDEFLQQMAGNTPINAVPADYSLTLKKATYSKIISANLFDKSAAKLGSIDGTTGIFTETEGYYTSEFIRVTAGDTLKFSSNVSRYAVYDANKVYVTGANLSTAVTQLLLPAGTYYIRVTFYYTNLDSFMLVVGTLPLSYQPFQMAIEGKNIVDIETGGIKDGAITELKTNFFQVGKNLALKDYLIKGQYVSSSTGNLQVNAAYDVFYQVPILPDTDYAWNYKSHNAFYNENGLFISGIVDGSAVPGSVTFRTPSNARFVSLSTKLSDDSQLELGTVTTSYEKPGLYLKESLIKQKDAVSESPVINLPDKVFATVGEVFKIYTANVLKERKENYHINYDASFGKQVEQGFEGTPTTAKTETVTVEVYDKSTLIATKNVSIKVSAARTTPLSVMVIGDSTIRTDTDGDGVGEGRVTQRLLDKLGANVNLVGTEGVSPNLHEGRSGWKASLYRTNTSYNGVVNPFYNPSTNDFDFAYYMTSKGFASVDVVIINLGINDVFSPVTDAELETRITQVNADFNFIVGSIKSYNSAIRVALNLTIPPNDTQNMFGAMYNTTQTQWRYKYNNHIWVANVIKNFAASCDLINSHSSIDTANNIADAVHPKIVGYNQIADTDVAYLNSLA